ncbi:MAG TPA: TIGR04283 family arsenosugar biosynthesis glycosyltransferase [Nitrospirota bacterium]|nr:TIGR04283 family arsenosugar biosynthesis glycosyltransferase [Nitrospirota bacterium]
MEWSPTLSIVLPVFKEAEKINEIIAHLRQQPNEEVEIIVVDGDPAGSTINGVIDEKVLKISASRSRARQMNAGAMRAKGDIILFLHADTLLPRDAFALIRDAVATKGAVGGAFDLGFDTKRRIFAITELYVALRTRLTRVPFGDQAIFIIRDYFEHIGGYRDIPLMEDVDLMKRIRKRCDSITIIPHKVRTSPRRYERDGVLYCTVRNLALQVLYTWGVPPEKLTKWYR